MYILYINVYPMNRTDMVPRNVMLMFVVCITGLVVRVQHAITGLVVRVQHAITGLVVRVQHAIINIMNIYLVLYA